MIESTTILDAVLPFRRERSDVLADVFALALGRTLARTRPRGELALDQMRRFGIADPESALRQLYLTSSRELVRILRRRYSRLDQSALKQCRIDGPTFYLSYHLGNWEWLGGVLSNLHGDFRPVTRGVRSPTIHRWVQSLRSDVGMKSMIDHDGLRGGRRALDEGAMLAFLADQTPPGARRPGICLGHKLPVSSLPEWWAKGKDFRWITGTLLSLGKESYQVTIHEFPRIAIHDWDRILDAHHSPTLHESPHHYFGWWHHRLLSRPSKPQLPSRDVSRETIAPANSPMFHVKHQRPSPYAS
jgi:hypothetical protein